jgi:hypothetical protein
MANRTKPGLNGGVNLSMGYVIFEDHARNLVVLCCLV